MCVLVCVFRWWLAANALPQPSSSHLCKNVNKHITILPNCAKKLSPNLQIKVIEYRLLCRASWLEQNKFFFWNDLMVFHYNSILHLHKWFFSCVCSDMFSQIAECCEELCAAVRVTFKRLTRVKPLVSFQSVDEKKEISLFILSMKLKKIS